MRIPLPPALAADFEWAEAIFVEWGHRALVWASLLDTDVPIIGRVRKYEAMTPMPLLTAWEEVGRTIFVAETIRDVVAATADRKSTRLNYSHVAIFYYVFSLNKRYTT